MDYKDWLASKDLAYKNEVLHYSNHNVVELAQTYKTPLYIINEQLLRKTYRQLKQSMDLEYRNNDIHYAVKANSNLSLLKILKSEGSKFDCTSTGEIYVCLKAGALPEDIIFTGNMFTNEDFEYAIKQDITINLDSISQLERLYHSYKALGKNPSEFKPISFRINPEFGAGHHAHTITAGKEIKFGILANQVNKAYSRALELGFEKFGVHMHIGSGIINPNDYKNAADKYASIIKNLSESLDIKLEFIDLGGGLGIPYKPEEEPLDLKLYLKNCIRPIVNLIESKDLGEHTLKIEPGRYLSAQASILIAQINTIKYNGFKYFAGLDAGFNTLIRPTMYGSYHHIIKCDAPKGGPPKTYDIAGPICESGDILGRERELEELKEGEYLAILDAGAYGFVMSSQYNSRPRPAEVLINERQSYVIRTHENFDDLTRNQRIPEYLNK